MRLIAVLLMLAMSSGAASAGSVALDFGAPQTLTSTAEQDALLKGPFLDWINRQRTAANEPGFVTLEHYLKYVLAENVKQWLVKAKEHRAVMACEVWTTLSANAQNQIRTALGGNTPCKN